MLVGDFSHANSFNFPLEEPCTRTTPWRPPGAVDQELEGVESNGVLELSLIMGSGTSDLET